MKEERKEREREERWQANVASLDEKRRMGRRMRRKRVVGRRPRPTDRRTNGRQLEVMASYMIKQVNTSHGRTQKHRTSRRRAARRRARSRQTRWRARTHTHAHRQANACTPEAGRQTSAHAAPSV